MKTDEEDKLILACLKAIENGNCSSCDTCPIGKELFSHVPSEDRDRAIQEHRFGVGADDCAICGGVEEESITDVKLKIKDEIAV